MLKMSFESCKSEAHSHQKLLLLLLLLIEIEQKINDNENIQGIPGDLKVYDWDIDDTETYFDISVVNIMACKLIYQSSCGKKIRAAGNNEKEQI